MWNINISTRDRTFNCSNIWGLVEQLFNCSNTFAIMRFGDICLHMVPNGNAKYRSHQPSFFDVMSMRFWCVAAPMKRQSYDLFAVMRLWCGTHVPSILRCIFNAEFMCFGCCDASLMRLWCVNVIAASKNASQHRIHTTAA